MYELLKKFENKNKCVITEIFKAYRKTGEWFHRNDRMATFVKKYHSNNINGEIIYMKEIGR